MSPPQKTYSDLLNQIEDLEEELKQYKDKYSHVKNLLGIDFLTQLPNRYRLGEVLEEEVAYCRRAETPLSLIFFDIDDFKKVNDQFKGHAAGDEVLRQLACRLKKSLRRYDKIGRYGGEEFLIILKNESVKTAKIVAERTRLLIANEPFVWQDNKINVTISLGIAQLKIGQAVFNLIKEADEAMYQAKRKGKNRIVVNGEI